MATMNKTAVDGETTLRADQLREVSFPVIGMSCASCVNRIEKSVNKTPGVERVAVNLATERATVSYKPTRTDVATIAAAVERAGYGVADLPPEAVVVPTPPGPEEAEDETPLSRAAETVLP